MPFKGPQYSKILNPITGTQDPCFTFNVEYESISYIENNEISLQSIEKCILDNNVWWNTFITKFLESSAKSFSKPYTVETINKITKHTVDCKNDNIYPVNVFFTPHSIQIYGGTFRVHWNYTIEQMIIPDLEDCLPDSINKIEELNIDELPTETTDILELDNPTKLYDKQRMKEARLKAKLATYKAQRQLSEYCDKYGDVSDSESEYTSDEND